MSKFSQLSRRLFFSSSRSLSSSSLFFLNENERFFQKSVQRFVDKEVRPKVAQMEKDERVDPQLLRALFDNHLLGIEVDEAHAGAGGSFFQSILAVEALAEADAAIAGLVDVQNTVALTVLRHFGSEQLQSEWLPRLATDSLGSFCLSEMGSGSDAFALRTKAEVQENGDYLINGSKAWITSAREASVLMVFANADFSKGHRGITCFLVPADADGVEVGPPESKMGLKASSTCPVYFSDVRVPASSIVGNLGEGYKIAISVLNEGRIGIGALLTGCAQHALNIALPYLLERRQFGQPLFDFQAVQTQFSQAAMEVDASRLLVYRAARLKEANEPFVKEAAMAKLFASQTADRTSSLIVEMMGAQGYMADNGVEKIFRDVKAGAIYEGASTIQLLTIAKELKARAEQE